MSQTLFDRPVLALDPGMHTAVIKRASADRDKRWAVTGSEDKTVRIWSLTDRALLHTIRLPAGRGHVGKVYCLAMSPDGSVVAVAEWTRWTGVDSQEQVYLHTRPFRAILQNLARR